MQVWSFWLESLRATLEWLSTGLGLETGLSIVVLTLLLRLLLLPLSWHSAWRGCLQQKRQRLLQPELIELRERYKDEPAKLVEQTLRLYRARGFAPFELRPLAGALVQMPVLFGMFQVLRGSVEAARFLWVENLARPDFWLAVVAGVTTALMRAANPDLPEQARLLMIVLPAILAFVFALKFASALGVYWAVSNSFTAAQTWAVHATIDRRLRAGLLTL
jgi:YidC/Oxa1 family membrane protein insertase